MVVAVVAEYLPAGVVPDLPLIHDLRAEAYRRGGATGSDATTIVVSGDFVQSVQDRLPPGSDDYGRSRGSGFAGAKTMAGSAGRCVIVVDEVFGSATAAAELGRPDLQWDRILAHETWHSDVALRGEPSSSPGAVPGLALRTRFLAHCAWQALDEYRVERALWRRGWASVEPDSAEMFFDEVAGLQTELASGSAAINAVVDRFPTVSRLLGYFAAADDAERVPADLRWLVEPFWAAPPADEPASIGQLEASAGSISDVLERWLQEMFGVQLRSHGDQLFC